MALLHLHFWILIILLVARPRWSVGEWWRDKASAPHTVPWKKLDLFPFFEHPTKWRNGASPVSSSAEDGATSQLQAASVLGPTFQRRHCELWIKAQWSGQMQQGEWAQSADAARSFGSHHRYPQVFRLELSSLACLPFRGCGEIRSVCLCAAARRGCCNFGIANERTTCAWWNGPKGELKWLKWLSGRHVLTRRCLLWPSRSVCQWDISQDERWSLRHDSHVTFGSGDLRIPWSVCGARCGGLETCLGPMLQRMMQIWCPILMNWVSICWTP